MGPTSEVQSPFTLGLANPHSFLGGGLSALFCPTHRFGFPSQGPNNASLLQAMLLHETNTGAASDVTLSEVG